MVCCTKAGQHLLLAGLSPQQKHTTNLSQLLHQRWMINCQATKSSQRLFRFCFFAGLDQEAGSFWQKHHATGKDEAPGKLYGDGDAVGTGVGVVFGGVVYNGG